MSLRKAVDQMCKDCIYDPVGGEGTWRAQVEACTSTNCAIYQYRPTVGAKSRQNTAKNQPNPS